ncbi:MAG: phage portal protein [Pseudomonadota bacterium]
MVEHKSSPLQSLFTHSDPANAHWTASDYASLSRRGFMGNPIVYRCIRLISETAAAVPMLVYDGAQEIDDHPLLSLLRRPNERQSGKEFMETLIGHLLVSGNAYLELIRLEDEPRELHLLRPDRVKVVADSSGWVQGYDYQANGQHQVHSVVPGLASPVLHLTLFHPLDDHYGFAPLEAALMALDTHNAASQWNKALLDNSARPSGALVYAVGSSEHLSDDQFARLKSELEDGYTGAKSAGRPLLLEGGLDWKAMGYSPKDMDFVDGRHAAARDIALAFGVPPMLLGIPGDNTYSNYQEANRAFTRQTLLPMINRTLDAINHWFRSDFGDDVQLRIDDDRIEGLSMEREAFWSRINGADFLSQSEKREAVGYSPDRPESENDEEALS